MAIDIRIDGNPQEMRATGRWLRSQLSTGVQDCTSSNHQARSRSESEWIGNAGDSFRGMLTKVAPKVDDLVADIDGVGKSFETCADSLHTAQQGMRRAREIALAGGLQVAGSLILDPGPAPPTPQPPPANASPQTARAHEQAVQAHYAHAAKAKAYADAKQEADLARSAWRWARDTARAYWKNVLGKRYMHLTNFATGLAGGSIGVYKSSLSEGLADYDNLLDDLDESLDYQKKIGSGMWRSVDDKIDDVAVKQGSLSDDLSRTVRYGRAVSAASVVLMGVGIGLAIHNGKPPGRVIASSVFGALASYGTTLAVGAVAAAVGVSAPVWVTALAAVAVGIGATMLAKWAYDEFMPEDWQKDINEAFWDTYDAASQKAGDAYEAVSQKADDAWDTVTGTVNSWL